MRGQPCTNRHIRTLRRPTCPIKVTPLNILMKLPIRRRRNPTSMIPHPTSRMINLTHNIITTNMVMRTRTLTPINRTLNLHTPAKILRTSTLASLSSNRIMTNNTNSIQNLPTKRISTSRINRHSHQHAHRRRNRRHHSRNL